MDVSTGANPKARFVPDPVSGRIPINRIVAKYVESTRNLSEPLMISHRHMANDVHAELFRPFRVTVVSGRTFEIRQPEMIQLGRSTMTIFTYLSDEPEDAKEQQIEVSLLLTESVEPLETNARLQGV